MTEDELKEEEEEIVNRRKRGRRQEVEEEEEMVTMFLRRTTSPPPWAWPASSQSAVTSARTPLILLICLNVAEQKHWSQNMN